MDSYVNARKRTSFGIKTLLSLFALSMLIIFPSIASNTALAAGTLSNVFALPTNNIVNTKTTYDIIFRTASLGSSDCSADSTRALFTNSYTFNISSSVIPKACSFSSAVIACLLAQRFD